jgi:general secretion pathway protein B
MSYILDALKKAAEQRSGPSVEVRRLLSAPPISETSISRYVTLAVAGVGVLGVVVAVWIWSPRPEMGAPRVGPVASPAPVASIVSGSPPANAPAGTARDERPRGAIADKPRSPLAAVDAGEATPRTSGADARRAGAKSQTAETKPPRTTAAPNAASAPPAAATAPPAPPVTAALPSAPAPATARNESSKLRVEVIVYSEEPPQRWAFINGRKYREGDTIGDSARVEEIQSGGVVIVEDGRRVTLRP